MSGQLALVEKHLTALAPRMEMAIPRASNLPARQILQSVLIACEKAPALMECTAVSMQEAVFSACALGLLVDGMTGQGYLVKYGDKVQFQTGFKGYGTIAARSGFMLGGDNIFQGEKYRVRLGTDGIAQVDPDFAIRGPNAKLIASFATLQSNAFPATVDAMSMDEILAIQRISKGKRDDAPWRMHFNEMAKKTVKRRLGKCAPIDILQRAIALDDAADMGRSAYIRPEDQALMIDHEAQPLSPMQPPPAKEFSLDGEPRFIIVTADGEQDVGSLDAWRKTILDALGRAPTVGAIGKFSDRNSVAFKAIAEKYPAEVDDVRLRILERIADLKKGAS